MIEQAGETLEQLGTGAWLAVFGFAAAPIALASGRLEEGERYLRRSMPLLHEMGERGWLSTLCAHLAFVLHAMGRREEAMEMAAMSRELALPEDINAESFWKSITGRLLAERGEIDEGLLFAREAVALNRETDELNNLGELLRSLAEVADLAGRRDEVVASLTEAVEIFDRKENLVGAAKARTRLAELR
jgi:tetratricopeptide (TPR) repeat protein